MGRREGVSGVPVGPEMAQKPREHLGGTVTLASKVTVVFKAHLRLGGSDASAASFQLGRKRVIAILLSWERGAFTLVATATCTTITCTNAYSNWAILAPHGTCGRLDRAVTAGCVACVTCAQAFVCFDTYS